MSLHSLLTRVTRPRMRMSTSLAWAKMSARISAGMFAIGYVEPLVCRCNVLGGRHTAVLDFKMSSKSSSASRLLCNDVSINLVNERSSSTCFIVSCTITNCRSVEYGNPLSGANLYSFLCSIYRTDEGKEGLTDEDFACSPLKFDPERFAVYCRGPFWNPSSRGKPPNYSPRRVSSSSSRCLRVAENVKNGEGSKGFYSAQPVHVQNSGVNKRRIVFR